MSDNRNMGHGEMRADPTRTQVSQSGHGFVVGQAITFSGGAWVAADIFTHGRCTAVVAIVTDANTFSYQLIGLLTLTTAEWDAVCGTSGGLTAGTWYALSVAGGYSTLRIDPEQRVIYAFSSTTAMVKIENPTPFYLSPRVLAWGRWEATGRLPLTTDRDLRLGQVGTVSLNRKYVAGRAGVLELGNGTTSSWQNTFSWGGEASASSAMGPYVTTGQIASVRFTWNAPVLSNSVARFLIYAGWCDRADLTAPINYAMMLYLDNGVANGTLAMRTSQSASGLNQITVGTTAAVANTWYKTRVEMTTTAARHYSATTGAETLECTDSNTSYLPLGMALSPIFTNASQGGSAPAERMVLLEKMEWELFVP